MNAPINKLFFKYLLLLKIGNLLNNTISIQSNTFFFDKFPLPGDYSILLKYDLRLQKTNITLC